MGRCAIHTVLLVGVTGCFIKPDPPGVVSDAGVSDVQDGAPDAAPPCTTWGAWGSATPLSALSSSATDDFGPSLSKDELHIVWNRGSNLMEAERASLTGSWMNVRSVDLFGFAGGAHLSDNALTLYFHKYEPGPDANIMVTTRSSLTSAWEGAFAFAPFNTFEHERDLEISWNGLDAVVYVGEDTDNQQEDIAISSRAMPTGQFPTWMRIATASRIDSYDCCPGISPDGLEVYWEVDAMWRVRRSDRGAEFGPAEMVPGLDDPSLQYGDPHFNATGNRLYFARRTEGVSNYDLYVAERSCAD